MTQYYTKTGSIGSITHSVMEQLETTRITRDPTESEIIHVRKIICANAFDVQDARQLLDMIGLLP